MKHVKKCEEVKKLWAASECGKKDTGPLESDFIKRRGLPWITGGNTAAGPRTGGLYV